MKINQEEQLVYDCGGVGADRYPFLLQMASRMVVMIGQATDQAAVSAILGHSTTMDDRPTRRERAHMMHSQRDCLDCERASNGPVVLVA